MFFFAGSEFTVCVLSPSLPPSLPPSLIFSCFSLSRYVCQSRCPPELALDALLVLSGLCHTPKAGMDLAITLAGNKVRIYIGGGKTE